MNKPSSTIQAAGIGAIISGGIMIAMAMFAPEYYDRLRDYPGAEAYITGLVAFVAGYFKKENVIK